MLRDSEIVLLRKNEEYRRLTELRLENLVYDLIKAKHTDLKPEVGTVLRALHALAKARLIRRELIICTREFLERLVNYQLEWERSPASIRHICESNQDTFLWMRYDEPRVRALFNRSLSLITEAEFRDVLKNCSTTVKDKDKRLLELKQEIDDLEITTIRSIRTRQISEGLVALRFDEYYRENELLIQQEFISRGKGGPLGLPPKPGQNEEDPE